MEWFNKNFIEEAKKALYRHSGTGSDSEVDVGDTVILVDENGYEVAAVMTDEEVDLTATANDIRLGTLAVTDDGITEGTKEIPSYVTEAGYKLIPNGSVYKISDINKYDYTKLIAMICIWNKTTSNSVAAEKVVIDDYVYATGSTEKLSTVTGESDTMSINFGLTNNSGSLRIIRYMTYKEVV